MISVTKIKFLGYPTAVIDRWTRLPSGTWVGPSAEMTPIVKAETKVDN